MMRTATYTTVPQSSDPRRHKIPIDVIRHVSGKSGDVQCALDGIPCLLTFLVVTRERVEQIFDPIIVKAVSGGEIRIGARLVRDYPKNFSPGQFLVVTIAPLE